MARTAPTVTTTPTWVLVSFRFIDANGQLGAFSYVTTSARATVANVEAAAVALGAASNANLYEVRIENVTGVAPLLTSAVEEPRESVKDVIVELWRDNVTRNTQEVYIPAPLDSLFVVDTNDPDMGIAEAAAVETAFTALLPASYGPISFRFSEHKGVNKKTRK